MMDNNLPAHYSLYALNDAYLNALCNMHIDENGEVIGAEHLQLLKDARDQKARNYAFMILILQSELDAVEKEKQRVTAIQNSLKKKIDWLTGTLQTIVKPGEKLDRISWRESTAVEITSTENIPEDCMIVELTPVKSMLKKKLEQGEIIEGCQLVKRLNIQIK